MLIEIIEQDKCEVFISKKELDRYHVDFYAMNAGQPETRKLLDDALRSLKNIGMRKPGQTASVECSKLGGGCLLTVTVFAPSVK